MTTEPDGHRASRNVRESSGNGGADRDRTDDLRLAKPALSQLSYSPAFRVVGLGRFELPTSRLSGVRSNHLSYRPARGRAIRIRPEPPGLSLKTG